MTERGPSSLAGRFTIVRTLGAGAFGRVLEAWDQERDAPVALKNLHAVDPASIYSFKQEFRGLADVIHPNLARLHELLNAGGEWWLVMELVDGVPFREWVGGSRALGAETLAATATLPPRGAERAGAPLASPEPIAPAWFDEARLRAALLPLAAGVQALHDAGKLHRDLKPSNVLVTPAGRVVVLDFGLVAELDRGLHRTHDRRIQGTPAYMAPEQIERRPLTPAADWYAVGVMLYEILRGKQPFTGNPSDILFNKLSRDALDPRIERPDLPPDLVDLAIALLARDPAARPTGAEIARRLGDAPPNVRVAEAPFVGRERELAALEEALVATREGRPVVVRISGSSGVGKTALVRRFVESVAETGGVVLAGRCHERESVPYKAFDGIVDALTQYLGAVPAEEAERLVPTDARALARVFPVYGRLPCATRGRDAAPDALELRRRAFFALRDVLGRIAAARPLVVWIDDFHWGDLDSAVLLADLLAPPDPPPLLLLASHRSEDAKSPLLSSLESIRAPSVLELGPLPTEDARTLASVLLAESDAASDAQTIAVESGGSPLFVEALARHVRAGGEARAVSLPSVLEARLRELPATPRRLLELLAVAGGPTPQDALRTVVGVGGQEAADAESVLRSARLVRAASRGGGWELDVLHEAIREAAVASLDEAALRSTQLALAEALESSKTADPEVIARLFRSVEDAERARPWVVRAADRAADALAFDRAAALYRVALDPPPREGAQALRVRLAEALGNAGRGSLAAQAFLAAVAGAPEHEALALERRAAETLLRSGHIDEGVEIVTRVLEQVGLRLAPSPARALASLLAHRSELASRGYGFEPRPGDRVDPRALARIDVCWSVGNGFGCVDLIRSADFQARHMLLALDAGEPYRIARACSWEAILAGVEGRSEWLRAEMLTERAEALAQEIAHPHALAWAVSATAVTAWCRGSFRQSLQLCEYSEALFRERCADTGWEVASLELWWLLPALWFLGETGALARRVQVALKEASDRGDRYALTTARTYVSPRLHLLAGSPEEVRRETRDAIAAWSKSGFHLQHWAQLLAECEADLYEGNADAALSRLARSSRDLSRSRHMRSVVVRCLTHDLRGRALVSLASARGGSADPRTIAAAERAAARLEEERIPWAAAAAASIRAGVLVARGLDEAASGAFAAACAAFEAEELALHAAAARRRAGELAGSAEAVAAADAALRARGVADPARYALLLAPGARG